MKSEKIQRALLRFLKEEKDRGVRGITIQDLHHSCCAGLAKSVGRIADVDDEIIWADLQEAAWALLSRGFLWLATDQIHSSSFWRFQFTDKGLAAANDEDVNPDNPERYMELLLKESPRTSETVQLYLKESLRAFDKDCFLSSAVMLGVAAEAWMLDTAGFYVVWAGKPAQKLAELLKNPRTFYVKKLEEFQKTLATEKSKFPSELSDHLDLNVTAVLQLIRLTRNDAGHPTGRKLDRRDCFNHLIIYARAHAHLSRLQDFFTK